LILKLKNEIDWIILKINNQSKDNFIKRKVLHVLAALLRLGRYTDGRKTKKITVDDSSFMWSLCSKMPF
jgi:hypothetical protein